MDYLKLWGKTREDNSAYPLICHMLDSSAVADEWLNNDPLLLNIFIENSGLEASKNDFINLLLWITAMHDVGKATVCFQNKVPALAKNADIFDENRQKLPFNHGQYGAYLFSLYETNGQNENADNFKSILTEFEKDKTKKTIIDLLKSSSWHHGNIFNSSEINDGFQNESSRSCAFQKIEALRDNLIGKLVDFFKIKELKITSIKKYHPSILKCFAGFISVCDWVASGDEIFDGKYFEVIETHYENASQKAKEAFKKLGIINIPTNNDKKEFAKFFDFTPRGIQTEIENIIDKNENLDLLIIEAPTGEGKTEAALYSHYRLENKGLYFALPSQATANQMFKRIESFYERQINQKPPIILAHGMAWLNKDYQKSKNQKKELETNSGFNSLNEWFYTRKKTLLAPVGIGTVDQAMLSVLKTKHYFVKLFALAGKTLIIDEVHAYDFFMMPIIRRLLEWCRFLKIKVILLSATLPQIMKKELLNGYLGNKNDDENMMSKNEYPLITVISENNIFQYPVQSTRKKEKIKIKLLKYSGEIKTIVNTFKDKIIGGGNILWICNTVKRSQDVYECLKETFKDEFDIILFHSRFTYKDRSWIENEVTKFYGKEEGKNIRPLKSIVVSTQVVEQSLDVDFDYMISDVAPIDLLLQRFGRMHRHERDFRPDGFKTPECLILIPECEIKGPVKVKNWKKPEDLKGFAEVYDPMIIYRTIKTLSENEIIRLPEMYRSLVESVYSENNDFSDTNLSNINITIKKESWENSYQCYCDEKEIMETEALKYITESPDKPLDVLQIDTIPTYTEEDEKATSFIAKTRYGNELEINFIISRIKDERVVIGNVTINLNDKLEDATSFEVQKQII